MKKQIKIVAILGTALIIGGVSALSIFTTSCGGSDHGPVEKIDISSVIESKDLGQISNNQQSTIKQAIISKNSATATWTWNQLNFSIGNNFATISALPNSTLYVGTVTVGFTLPTQKTELHTLIVDTGLGPIDNNSQITIQNAIIAVNLSTASNIIWNQLTFFITNNSATISALPNSALYTGTVIVSFNLPVPTPKTKLSDLIEHTDLGAIEDKQQTTIKNAIIANNSTTASDINWEQIVISAITTTGAHVAASSSSELYTGSVDVEFALLINISTLIEHTDLDKITNNDQITIQNAIIDMNPGAIDIDWQQIAISPITTTSAHVAASSTSKKYTGSVDVSFTLPDPTPKTTISELIPDTDLGPIQDTDLETIKAAIVFTNPSTTIGIDWSQIVIWPITTTGANVAASSTSKDYSGSVDIYFNLPDPKTELSNIIVDTNLGPISDNNRETIEEAIVRANPSTADNIDWRQISVSISNDSAEFSARPTSALYTGSVVVNFTLPVPIRVELSTLIENTDLDKITDNDEITIQNAIIDMNPGAIGIDWSQIEMQITTTSAHVAASDSSELYTGYVDVSFTLPDPTPKTKLSSLIENTYLDEISVNDEITIQNAIIDMNPDAIGIDWSQIEFTDIGLTTAHIVASDSSELYTGYVDVSFTLPDPTSKTKLSDLIKNFNLDEINDDDPETIKEAIVMANPSTASDIDWSQIEFSLIKATTAHIAASTSSADYYGDVDIYFTLSPIPKTKLFDLIQNTYLDEISDNDKTTIQNAIIAANESTATDIDWSQIEITDIGLTTAHIAASSTSKDYWGFVNVQFTLPDHEPTELFKLIQNTELDEILDNKQTAIENAIIDKNPDTASFDWSQVEFTLITLTEAVISATDYSTLYTGTVSVFYTLSTPDTRTLLSDLIVHTDLGELPDHDWQTIVDMINILNPDTEFYWSDILFSNITTTGAHLSTQSDSKIYTGAIHITFNADS